MDLSGVSATALGFALCIGLLLVSKVNYLPVVAGLWL